MSSIMMRIGVLFAVLGFGSFILEQFNRSFLLISWADDMQPTFGIVLGLVGVALIVVSLVLNRSKAAPQPQQQFAQQPLLPRAPCRATRASRSSSSPARPRSSSRTPSSSTRSSPASPADARRP